MYAGDTSHEDDGRFDDAGNHVAIMAMLHAFKPTAGSEPTHGAPSPRSPDEQLRLPLEIRATAPAGPPPLTRGLFDFHFSSKIIPIVIPI